MTDDEALELCLRTALESPEDIKGRHKQIQAYIDEGDREGGAQLSCYILQRRALKLPPWEPVPCYGHDKGNGPGARLVRRLRRHGISIFHPNPLRALREVGAGTGTGLA